MRGYFEIGKERIAADWVVDRWVPDTLPDGTTRLVRDGSIIPHRSPGHWEAVLPDGRTLSSANLPAGIRFIEEDDESLVS